MNPVLAVHLPWLIRAERREQLWSIAISNLEVQVKSALAVQSPRFVGNGIVTNRDTSQFIIIILW
jgi:hypothetical protein